MIASAKGHFDVVKTLIEAGANVSHTNKVGKYMYNVHCTLVSQVRIQVFHNDKDLIFCRF